MLLDVLVETSYGNCETSIGKHFSTHSSQWYNWVWWKILNLCESLLISCILVVKIVVRQEPVRTLRRRPLVSISDLMVTLDALGLVGNFVISVDYHRFIQYSDAFRLEAAENRLWNICTKHLQICVVKSNWKYIEKLKVLESVWNVTLVSRKPWNLCELLLIYLVFWSFETLGCREPVVQHLYEVFTLLCCEK